MILVVFAQASGIPKPRKSPLDDPPPRDDFKAFRGGVTLDHLKPHAHKALNPRGEVNPSVPTIDLYDL